MLGGSEQTQQQFFNLFNLIVQPIFAAGMHTVGIQYFVFFEVWCFSIHISVIIVITGPVFFTKTMFLNKPVTGSMKQGCCLLHVTSHYKMTQFFLRWCQPKKSKLDSHYVILPSLNMIIKFSLMYISLWTPSWAGFNMYSAHKEKCSHLRKKW